MGLYRPRAMTFMRISGVALSKGRQLILFLAVIACAVHSVQADDAEIATFNISSYASRPNGSYLLVFPTNSRSFSISLPAVLRRVVYGADGRSLYAEAAGRPGITRIDFNPLRLTALPGSDKFVVLRGFAVSKGGDKALISGRRSDLTNTCGIFELNLATGLLRPVFAGPDCRAGSPWRVLDLSSDGTEALIRDADGRVDSLHLASGSLTALDKEAWLASYSPDGKWIAELWLGGPHTPSKTVLVDRSDLTRRRDLGGVNDDEVVWSPDSRTILHAVPRPTCSSQNPVAIEELDAITGARSIAENTACQAGASRMIGWLSSLVHE